MKAKTDTAIFALSGHLSSLLILFVSAFFLSFVLSLSLCVSVAFYPSIFVPPLVSHSHTRDGIVGAPLSVVVPVNETKVWHAPSLIHSRTLGGATELQDAVTHS